MRRTAVALVLLVSHSCGSARASFESLPGPDTSSMVGVAHEERALRRARGDGGFAFAVSGGQPAPVEGLLWSHLLAVHAARSGTACAIEAYALSLENAYRETLAGFWIERSGFTGGIRLWSARWDGIDAMHGWSASIAGRRSWRRFGLGVAILDQPIGSPRAAAPPRLLSATGWVPLGSLGCVEAGWLGAGRDGGGRAGNGGEPYAEVELRPAPSLGVTHGVRWRDMRWRSGMRLRLAEWDVRVWIEPDALRGASAAWSIAHR